MKIIRLLGSVFAVALVAAAVTLYFFHPARASDHQDSPTVVHNPMEDITDMYFFPAPDNPNNDVFVVDFYPLIQPGQKLSITFDPTVLYQIKIAHNYPTNSKEDLVLQMKANSAGTSPTFTLYGPAAPNQAGTTDTLVSSAGTFPFNQSTTLSNGIQVFVGPRHDPFFFDLAQFFKILPDRSYTNHPEFGGNVPPATATSFNFPSASTPVLDVTGTPYGTAGALACTIAQPSDFLQVYDVESFVVSIPKSMLVASGGTAGPVGFWSTASTPSGM